MKEKTIINIFIWIATILLYVGVSTAIWGVCVFYKIVFGYY